jgi:hypothetical protein
MTTKGKTIVAAKANLRPYRAELGKTIETHVRSEMPLGDDLDSDSDLDEWMSD